VAAILVAADDFKSAPSSCERGTFGCEMCMIGLRGWTALE